MEQYSSVVETIETSRELLQGDAIQVNQFQPCWSFCHSSQGSDSKDSVLLTYVSQRTCPQSWPGDNGAFYVDGPKENVCHRKGVAVYIEFGYTPEIGDIDACWTHTKVFRCLLHYLTIFYYV